jgi:hypothetical protein
MSDVNTPEALQKIAECRLQKLIWYAHMNKASEIKIHRGGIEITVGGLVTTPLMRAAVSLQECYPDGGVYVASDEGMLVLCVYYKSEA